MHYIVGTKFSTHSKSGGGMRSSSAFTTPSRNLRYFQKGMIYELYNIKKIEKDGNTVYDYYFVSDTKDEVHMLFNSLSDADHFIAELRSEELPNYEELHRARKD